MSVSFCVSEVRDLSVGTASSGIAVDGSCECVSVRPYVLKLCSRPYVFLCSFCPRSFPILLYYQKFEFFFMVSYPHA